MSSRVLTVMFTDIKGFTERTSATSRADLRNLLDIHEKLLHPVVAQFKGSIVKTIGDALLVTFESPTNALLCGMLMQERLREYNLDLVEGEQIHIRVAINTGEVEERDGDIFGEAVNIAARIEGITEPSEIFFTESVYLSMNKAEVPSSAVGEHRLKGIPEAIRIYQVIQDRNEDRFVQLIEKLKSGNFDHVQLPSTGGDVDLPLSPRKKKSMLPLAVIIGFAVIVVIAVVIFQPDRTIRMKVGVEEAVALQDFALAFKRADAMLEKFPTRKESTEALRSVMKAQIDWLVAKEQYEDANKKIEEWKEKRTTIDTSPFRKTVLYAIADMHKKNGSTGWQMQVYSTLMQEFPRDPDVARRTVEEVGADWDGGTSSAAVWAAEVLAEQTEGQVDDVVGRTLLAGMAQNSPDGSTAERIRKTIRNQFTAALPQAHEMIKSEKPYPRLNAYRLLKECGELQPEEEARYHIYNIQHIGSTHGGELGVAAEYFMEKSKDENWPAFKKSIGVEKLDRIRSLETGQRERDRVINAISSALFPEAQALVMNWYRDSENQWLFRASVKLLQDAGMDEILDDFTIHSRVLDTFSVGYEHPDTFLAYDYMASRAQTEDADRALKALLRAKQRAERAIENWQSSGNYEGWVKTGEKHLAAIEAALKSFE